MIRSYGHQREKERAAVEQARPFSSPWTLDSSYWIVVHCADKACRDAIAPTLARNGARPLHGDDTLAGWQTGADWSAGWEMLAEAAKHLATTENLRAAVIAAAEPPSHQEILFALRPFAEIDAVAGNLWLAHALGEGRLLCFMQPAKDRRGKVIGYEAFARIAQEDGGTVGGGAIMQASHAMRLEYQVDRILHREAIRSFVEFDLDGFIFINFLTGFIHRPEVYLEGLSQAVEQYRLVPRSVVLDVPLRDYAQNIAKVKTIAHYCRSRGFNVALDDVLKPDGLAPLLAEIRPAFVKLDPKLGLSITDPRRSGPVSEIIRLAHEAGATVLAEGIESETVYQAYLAAGADMFQGYFLGAPERYPPAPARKSAG
jgi:EAL domain-containing protein (putative c-di-GMP-specific phosphodiesterase class I)